MLSSDNRLPYEPPTLEAMGTLRELTMGGNVPINELPNQPNVNNNAFPPRRLSG